MNLEEKLLAMAILLFTVQKKITILFLHRLLVGAKEAGGITIGVTYGKGKEIWEKDGFTDILIVTGLERGGGREFVLVNSCDAIIAISGGSGTLTEMAIAYQSDIPIIAMSNTGGWADKLGGTYIDGRNRLKVEIAATPDEAVKKALELAMYRG